MTKKNLIVGQSGGPTAVINSSLYGVVSEGIAHSDEIGEVYGMVNGIEGFLEDRILNFREALPGEQLDYLKHTPGAYLGSCRYKLPESLEEFASFPLMDGQALADAGLSMLCVSQGDISRVVTLQTSGTEGRPKRIFYTAGDQELTVSFFSSRNV